MQEHIPEAELSDKQWLLVEKSIAPSKWQKRNNRDYVNAAFYRMRTMCAWDKLPKRFQPWQSVHEKVKKWEKDGTLASIIEALRTGKPQPYNS